MIGKLFSKLFGGGQEEVAETPPATEYKGFSIQPTPKNTGTQWQVAGVIIREMADGQRREESFIRADTCTSRDEAVEMIVRKAKQIIDERGARFLAD